uniref:Uncharacterized protein n=1 Tax=Glossina morsitans morsitans TaxID=37546 RepID=A0A1B0FG05_GLOMM
MKFNSDNSFRKLEEWKSID